MVNNSFTAVIEKNSTFTGPFDTEPYEAAWAREARWFIRAIDLQGALSITPQISPDGLFWCNEGRDPLVIREPGLHSFTLREFGGWLRLHGDVTGEQAKTKVLIYLVLKE
jgi:hypothetical protein